MNDEFKQKLLRDIGKSGFPLELSVVEKLRRSEMIVHPNLSFSDASDKPREIDAYVTLPDHDLEEEGWPFGCIHLDLFIECKTSSAKPWVFFRDDDDTVLVAGLVGNLECVSDLKADGSLPVLAGCMNGALREHHFNTASWNGVPVARTYMEAFGHDAGKEIYQAVTNIWHALDFQRRWFLNPPAAPEGVREPKHKRTIFMHGVIVLRGLLVAAAKVGDGFELAEVPHVMLRTIDCVTNKSLPFGAGRETVIDVVHEDYFEEYLSLCVRDRSLCGEHLMQLLRVGWLEQSISR